DGRMPPSRVHPKGANRRGPRRARTCWARTTLPDCGTGPLAQAHAVADFVHRGFGLRSQPVGAGLEDAVELRRVGHQLEVALPGRRVVADDPVGEQPLRVDAAGPRGPLAVP